MTLRFEPAGDVVAAAQAIRECVPPIVDAHDERLQASGDPSPPYVGGWSWLRVSDAVLVNAIESDIVDEILPELARALEHRGIEGVFRLREPVPGILPPSVTHLVECRIRVRGRRVRFVPQDYRWMPDRDAHAAILIAADEWLRRQPGSTACSIDKDTFGSIPVPVGEVLADRMIDAVEDALRIRIICAAGDEVRCASARSSGGVSLVAAGPSIADGGWQTALADFTALLRELADHVAYAYVRRGSMPYQALLRDALSDDWPRRPDDSPRRPTTAQAFEDVYAPDTFGVQLLGPGYHDRLPDSPSWRHERVGQSSVLLEHIDAPAWFGAKQHPVPAVLNTARIELAPLLYTPGILHRTGSASEPEL